MTKKMIKDNLASVLIHFFFLNIKLVYDGV